MSEIHPEVAAELAGIRQSIDNLDSALIRILAERFKLTKDVGILKAKHKLPSSDLRREAEQLERLRALAEESHLDPAFAEKWFNFVVEEVVRHHKEIAAAGSN